MSPGVEGFPGLDSTTIAVYVVGSCRLGRNSYGGAENVLKFSEAALPFVPPNALSLFIRKRFASPPENDANNSRRDSSLHICEQPLRGERSWDYQLILEAADSCIEFKWTGSWSAEDEDPEASN